MAGLAKPLGSSLVRFHNQPATPVAPKGENAPASRFASLPHCYLSIGKALDLEAVLGLFLRTTLSIYTETEPEPNVPSNHMPS